MRKFITIFLNSETSNPLSVDALIAAQKENGSWYWSVDRIESIELVVGDKEGVDITKSIVTNARALALIMSQVADEELQIIDAFVQTEDENSQVEAMKERRCYE